MEVVGRAANDLKLNWLGLQFAETLEAVGPLRRPGPVSRGGVAAALCRRVTDIQ